jgi:hypothetical protein
MYYRDITTHVMGLHNATAVVSYFGESKEIPSECDWFVPGTYADDAEMEALHDTYA